METTNELLDQVKEKYHLASDYALAKKLGIRASAISGYRHERSSLANEIALKVAELLELDAGFVLASMEAERSHSEAAKAAWERAAERLNALAAREAAGDCILCQIGRTPYRSAARYLKTMPPGVIMAVQGRFSRPGHVHP